MEEELKYPNLNCIFFDIGMTSPKNSKGIISLVDDTFKVTGNLVVLKLVFKLFKNYKSFINSEIVIWKAIANFSTTTMEIFLFPLSIPGI